jgi:hypothetical protein
MDRIFLAGKMAERRKEVAVGRTVDVEGSEKEEAAEVVEGSLHRMVRRRMRDGGL